MAQVDHDPSHTEPLDPELDRLLGEFSHVLWHLRDLTSQLVYRLEVQQLVLVSGRVRWVNFATEDVDEAIDAIRRVEEVREDMVRQLSPLLGTDEDATLRDLSTAAPSPWDVVLSEHQADFLTLAAEAEDAAKDNRELLQQGLTDVRELMDSLRGGAANQAGEQSYGSRAGSIPTPPASAVLVDKDV